MHHIINKLLLIDNFNLIKDIVELIKETYIICSAVVILPPRPDEWNKNKIGDTKEITFYINEHNIYFRDMIFNPCWTWSTCINYYQDKTYEIIYRINDDITLITDFYKSHINHHNNMWYDKDLSYIDIDNDDCFDYIVPVYYFPPN